MSIFAFLGGRFDRKAWGRALFAAGCKLPVKPDVKKYEKATDQIIRNDCRIITESAQIIRTTQDEELRSQQKIIMFSRYSHLSHLEPYANRQQRDLILEAKSAAAKARKVK